MANVRRTATVWPWIAAVGMIVGLIWIVVARQNRQAATNLGPAENAPATEVGTTGPALAPPVENYLAFAAGTKHQIEGSATAEPSTSSEAKGKPAAQVILPAMGLGHEYTAEGLRRLADALAAVRGLSAEAAASKLRANADAIEKNPRSLEHADMVRDSFEAAATVIGAHAPKGARLREIASSIDPERPLLSQRDRVQRFFVAAGEDIRQLAAQS